MIYYPVKKVYITQAWGLNPQIYGQFGLKGHNGVDYRAFLPNGDRCYEGGKSEVFCPHDGKVIENLLDNGYGWYVKIENAKEGSILAHFSHQSPLKVGQSVKAGDFAGFQGTTGFSSGIHLHWGYYPIPRNKANGYSGTIDQQKLPLKQLSEIGAGQPEIIMNELLTYLGVSNETEAKAKLKEHLGENNSKCDWGNEVNGGGHLGSARRQLKTNQDQIQELKEVIVTLEKQIADHVCPITSPNAPETGWVANGKSVTTEENGVTTTINYAVKR